MTGGPAHKLSPSLPLGSWFQLWGNQSLQVVCLEVGNGVISSSTCCVRPKLAWEKLTTTSERFLMVECAIASSAWAMDSSSLVSCLLGVLSDIPIVS